MLRQGAQALDPAAAHGRGRPGRSSQGARLPKQPGQQLPLLGIREASGDLSTCPGRRFCGSEAGEAPLWGNLLVSCRPKGLWAAVLLGGGRWPQSASTADAAFQGREPQAKNWAGHRVSKTLPQFTLETLPQSAAHLSTEEAPLTTTACAQGPPKSPEPAGLLHLACGVPHPRSPSTPHESGPPATYTCSTPLHPSCEPRPRLTPTQPAPV